MNFITADLSLTIVIAVISYSILCMLCLTDLAGTHSRPNSNKIFWLLMLLFVPVFGMVLYGISRIFERKPAVSANASH